VSSLKVYAELVISIWFLVPGTFWELESMYSGLETEEKRKEVKKMKKRVKYIYRRFR